MGEFMTKEKLQQDYENNDLLELNIPGRCYRCLTLENIYTKKKLCELTEKDIRKVPYLGEKGRRYLRKAMAENGLKFKGQE